MDVLVGYGVIPWKKRILGQYWDRLLMVEGAGRYYSTPFKGHQGFTQWDPLSPTIFNMVFDAVICHWVTLVVG